MVGVGSQGRKAVLEGGGADQSIGKAHAVQEGQRIDRTCRALRDRWREGTYIRHVLAVAPHAKQRIIVGERGSMLLAAQGVVRQPIKGLLGQKPGLARGLRGGLR